MVNVYRQAVARLRPRATTTHEGGVAFEVDTWTRLQRFLILGTDGGTFYVGEREITLENAAVVRECLDQDAARTVELIATISESGRAARNDPAIFALALAAAHADPVARGLALAAL